MAETARLADVNPEYADAQLCPRLTALRELYALLVACTRNHGARTTHRFRGVDAGLLKTLGEAARAEGFVVDAASGAETTITVGWR